MYPDSLQTVVLRSLSQDPISPKMLGDIRNDMGLEPARLQRLQQLEQQRQERLEGGDDGSDNGNGAGGSGGEGDDGAGYTYTPEHYREVLIRAMPMLWDLDHNLVRMKDGTCYADGSKVRWDWAEVVQGLVTAGSDGGRLGLWAGAGLGLWFRREIWELLELSGDERVSEGGEGDEGVMEEKGKGDGEDAGGEDENVDLVDVSHVTSGV